MVVVQQPQHTGRRLIMAKTIMAKKGVTRITAKQKSARRMNIKKAQAAHRKAKRAAAKREKREHLGTTPWS